MDPSKHQSTTHRPYDLKTLLQDIDAFDYTLHYIRPFIVTITIESITDFK